MVRHTKINLRTKIEVEDEILYKGIWKKVTSITKNSSDNKEYIGIDRIFLTLNDLIPVWEVSVFKDFSDSNPEYSINLITKVKAISKKSITLFNETGVAATKKNLEKLTAIANVVKDYMNKEGIAFEEEESCR